MFNKAICKSLVLVLVFVLRVPYSLAEVFGSGAASSAIAIKCGVLLDVIQKQATNDATIIVKDDRIVAIEEQAAISDTMPVVDLSNSYCLPGLMDMHFHLGYYDKRGARDSANESSASLAITALTNAQILLNDGFTTIRAPGENDADFGIVDVRDAINAGVVKGPRLFVAPHGLQPIWGYGHFADEGDKNELIPAGPDAMRDAVRNQVRHGADWIKTFSDMGLHPDKNHPDRIYRTFTDEELSAIVDETHALKKRIAFHAHGDYGARLGTILGADSIEHGFFNKDSTSRLMKEKGVYLVPTLSVFDYWHDEQATESLKIMNLDAEAVKEERKETREIRDEAFKYAYKIGVKIALGTDQVVPSMAIREFSYYTRLGVSPWDVISMATINGADLLGMKAELGSVNVGKYADIIATPDNPIDDVSALENVNFVMKAGEVIRFDDTSY